MYASIAEPFSHLWHAPTRRMHWVFVQEMSVHDQLSFVRFDARLCVLSLSVLRLLNWLFRSFLACGTVMCTKDMHGALPLKSLFDVLAAFVPISLGPLSFRGPRIVHKSGYGSDGARGSVRSVCAAIPQLALPCGKSSHDPSMVRRARVEVGTARTIAWNSVKNT